MQKINIIAATTNEHKIIEISAITNKFGISVVSRTDAGVPDFDIEEDGDTFEENSYIKAKTIMDYIGKPTIADDSGLMVDALNGAPGIYSARFADNDKDGEDFLEDEQKSQQRNSQDNANNLKLLRLLKDVPFEKRTAKFVSVITLLIPNKEPIVCRGEVHGHIAFEQIGENGFGYDSLFIPIGRDTTFGVISPGEKNTMSHRFRALEELKKKISVENFE